MNLDMGHFNLISKNPTSSNESDVSDNKISPNQNNYKATLRANLIGSIMGKILPFQEIKPDNLIKKMATENVLAATTETVTPLRSIPQTPDRILDAPELIADFYLNLLDWSTKNVIAVALAEVIVRARIIHIMHIQIL